MLVSSRPTAPNTGKDWQAKVPASQAATAYADHLQHLADADPLLLLPYVFSMHVPILLGFLGQRIQKTLHLPDERGLAFFTVSCGLCGDSGGGRVKTCQRGQNETTEEHRKQSRKSTG